jgi:hypothetical protein
MRHRLIVVLLALLGGCGLSQSYRESQLESASDYEVCYALTDPRQHSIGSGWAVKARAATAIAQRRGLSCDYEVFTRVHAIEAPARDAEMQRNLEMMQLGFEMMQGSRSPSGGASASGGIVVNSGTTWTQFGNRWVSSDGISCQQFGNRWDCSDGISCQQFGNRWDCN